MKITAIKQQVKQATRYSIFVDGKFAFGLSEAGLVESGLASGQELTADELKKLKKTAGVDKAWGRVLRYVTIRPRSQWEMETYLTRKQVDKATSQSLIRRLQKLNLLSDLEFARAWVSSRRQLKSTSRRRLSLELRQKHVTDAIIDQVLNEDQTDERQTLRDLIAKKRARYPDQQKLMQYLARQGFNYDDIKAALQEE